MTSELLGALVRDPADLLRIDGGDALDLLHRIAASDVRSIDAGGFGVVVLTDDKGRTIDAPTLHRRDDHLAMICGPTRGTATRAWIERWVITEDVVISPLDETVLEMVARDPREASSFVVQVQRVPTELDTIDLDAWRAHFLDAGVVVAGPALAAGPNPLEIGWHDRIGWTKGCYIGQEVVARLDTYDKVKRRVGVIDGATGATAGAAVRVGAKKVGMILDAVGARAIAVIDKSVERGAAVSIEDADDATIASLAEED